MIIGGREPKRWEGVLSNVENPGRTRKALDYESTVET